MAEHESSHIHDEHNLDHHHDDDDDDHGHTHSLFGFGSDCCCGRMYLWLFVLLLAYALVSIWQKWRVWVTFGKLGLDAEAPLPILGNLISILKQGMCDSFVTGIHKYGKVYGVFLPVGPAVVVADIDLLGEVFVKKFASFPNRQRMPEFEVDPWRHNILTLKGERWKQVRTRLSPAFTSSKLKQMMPAIERVTEKLAARVEAMAETGQPVELKRLCGAFAMNAIAGGVFGIEVDSLDSDTEPFVKHAMSILNPRNPALHLIGLFPWLAPVLDFLGIRFIPDSATRFFVSAVTSALEERKQHPQNFNDFLQVLVNLQEEGESGAEHTESHISQGLTQDEMFANAMIFLMAGYETVSSALAFTLYCLAANPQCLKTAHAELDSRLTETGVSYSSTTDLPYLEKCINEALRLYPTTNVLKRQASETCEVGGHVIPRDYLVLVPVRALHLDPLHWSEPLQFNPDRFDSPDHPAFSYLPFGAGPRGCIGKRLAMTELRLALTAILSKVTVELTDNSQYPPKLRKISPHLASQDGLLVKFVKRSKA